MADQTKKPVIFLAFANDRDDTVGYLRNLPDEARRLHAVLEAADRLCEVEVRSNSTAGDIFKVFQNPKFRNRIAIFHYSGHANGYQLLLESPEGKAAAADAGGLAAFLAQQQGLQLVFLNGCSTQQQTQELHDANVSVVISTSRSIDDKVATDFADLFYQGLASGANLLTAYNEASAAIKTTKGGDLRALYFGDADKPEDHRNKKGSPWNLYPREGAESADQWSLPNAVDDPLFGLPPLPEQNLPESPYRHLNWYTREDAEIFFGRGHQIRELYNLLTAGTQPIILFYGQSGVGKSSLLDAGLFPRLERNYEVRYVRRGTGGLLATLQTELLSEDTDVPIETAWLAKEERLKKPLNVFLDQVEEFYTRPIKDLPDELDQLLRVVKATFCDPNRRPKGKLVLGFREEWLAKLESQVQDYQLPRTKVFLKPLDRRGIIEVVQGPTRSKRLRERYALTVEPGLAEIIADALLADRGSAISTTLQILLSKMWTKATEANSEHPQFSQHLYHQLRRDGILLRDFLNQQVAAFAEQNLQAEESGLMLDILARHTTLLGTSDQCTEKNLREEYHHMVAALPDILQSLQDLHLLAVTVVHKKASIQTTRVMHDTLAPLIRERFDASDKPGQRARRILDNRSRQWYEGKKGPILEEADLNTVEIGLHGTRDLNEQETRLVQASRTARARRRRNARAWRISGIVAVALILASGGTAGVLWRIAERNSTLYQARVEGAEARIAYDTEPLHALATIVSVLQRISDPTEQAAMLQFLREFSAQGRLARLGDDVTDIFTDAEARWVVLQRGSSNGKICNATNGSLIQELGVPFDDCLFFRTPESRFCVVTGTLGSELRRVPDAQLVANLQPNVTSIALSHDPDRKWMFVRYDGQRSELRRTTDGSVTELTDNLVSVQFGRGNAKGLMVVDYPSGTPPELRRIDDELTLIQFSKPVKSLGFAPSCLRQIDIVKIGESSPFQIEDSTISGCNRFLRVSYQDGTEEWLRINDDGVAPLSDKAVEKLSFTRNNSHFVATHDNKATLFRAADAKPLCEFPEDREKWEFSNDAHSTFIVIHRQGRLEVLRTAAESVKPIWFCDGASDIQFSEEPAAAYCVVFFENGAAELRRTSDGQIVQTLSDGSKVDISFQPEDKSTYCSMKHGDGSTQLFQTDSGKRVVELPQGVDIVDVYPELGYLVAKQQQDASSLMNASELMNVAYGLADGQHRVVNSTRGDLQYGHAISSDPAFPYYTRPQFARTTLYHLGSWENWELPPVAPYSDDAIGKVDETGAYIYLKAADLTTKLFRTSDKRLVATIAPGVETLFFLPESHNSLLHVKYTTGRDEIWLVSDNSTRLVDLGLNLKDVRYVPSESMLVVWYNDLRADLLDVQWLHELRGQAEATSAGELIRAAEAIPLRRNRHGAAGQ